MGPSMFGWNRKVHGLNGAMAQLWLASDGSLNWLLPALVMAFGT